MPTQEELKIRRQLYYQKTKEAFHEYYINNREKRIESCKLYRDKNPDYNQEYQKANREKIRLKQIGYREARKIQAQKVVPVDLL